MSKWDLDQKKNFTKAMGKKRARFARGGKVPKQAPPSDHRVFDLLEQHGETLQKFADGSYVQALNTTQQPSNVGGPTALTSPSSPVVPHDDYGKFLTVGGNENSFVNKANPYIPAIRSIGNKIGNIMDMTQNKFQATGAPIQAGTSADQLNQAYSNSLGGLGSQANFLNQAQGQQGFQHQNDVYNQLQGIAQGYGPNPAQNMLNQATGTNVANQAALMAGQRGSSANAGLMARQAAQQGAGIQQNAAGQGATMQANQSLNAQNQLAGIAQNQVNQYGQAVTGYNTAAQNEQNILQNANTSYNNSQVGMQSNLNNVNGQISQGNQSAKNGMMGGLMSGASSVAKMFMASGGEVGAANVGGGNYTSSNPGGGVDIGSMGQSIDMGAPFKDAFKVGGGKEGEKDGKKKKAAPTEGGVVSNEHGGGGGMAGGVTRVRSMYMADGGEVDETEAQNVGAGDVSTDVGQSDVGAGNYTSSAPSSGPDVGSMGTSGDMGAAFKDMFSMGGGGGGKGMMGMASGGNVDHHANITNYFADGGKVPALVSPGEVYLSPEKVRQVVEEGKNPMKVGQKIGGKAKKKDDSYANDTVPATLEEGGVVIPRHITTHKMSAEKAELFVHRAIARKKARK